MPCQLHSPQLSRMPYRTDIFIIELDPYRLSLAVLLDRGLSGICLFLEVELCIASIFSKLTARLESLSGYITCPRGFSSTVM